MQDEGWREDGGRMDDGGRMENGGWREEDGGWMEDGGRMEDEGWKNSRAMLRSRTEPAKMSQWNVRVCLGRPLSPVGCMEGQS